MREIFRSPKIMVHASPMGGDVLVIGFSFHPYPRPGAGLLAQLDRKHGFGFSIVDVVCAMSFPYPYEEVDAAITAIGEYARSFRGVVTFGESLGGFIALNFADRLGASTAVASSPPFTLSPEKMPSETRWGVYTRSVTAFPWDHIERGLAALDEVYLLYDPASPDVAHIQAIDAVARRSIHLPMPFGGHPVTRILDQAGRLGPLLCAIVEGRIDRAGFRHAVRASRRASPAYLRNLASAQPRRRDALRVRLFEMAQALGASTDTSLAMIPPLVRLGRKDEVQALSRSLVEAEAVNARRLNTLKKENDALRKKLADLERLQGAPKAIAEQSEPT